MKHFYSCLFLLCSFFTMAQNEPNDSLRTYDSLLVALNLPTKAHPYLQARFTFGALSNAISTSELLHFVNSDFLQKKDKDDLLNSVHGPLRYGYFREISLTYMEPGCKVIDVYKRGQGFGITNRYYNSARLSKDMLRLIFYGNKVYAGQTLDLSKTAYETWYYTSLDYHFDVLLDSVQPVRLTVSINAGHDHNYYRVKTGTLYTDPDGAYLDLETDYKLRERVNETQVLAGLGASIGAETDFRISPSSKLKLTVEDFGFIHWNNGRVLNADSSFRFKGVVFNNVLEINDSLRKATANDYRSRFYYNDVRNYTRLTPFRVSAAWFKKLDNPHFKGIKLSADYLFLSGYLPHFSAGLQIKTGFHQQLLTSVSTGGYNWASLDLSYQIQFAQYWNLELSIYNFSGLVVPVISGGAYGVLGLRYEL